MKEFAGWVRADASRKDELASVAFLRFMAGRFPCPEAATIGMARAIIAASSAMSLASAARGRIWRVAMLLLLRVEQTASNHKLRAHTALFGRQ